MVEPFTIEQGVKRPRDETALESQKRGGEEADVASPLCPKPRPKPQKKGPLSFLTCAPSKSTSTLLLSATRKRRGRELSPEGRGDAAKRQKTSGLLDPVVQDACTLFLSVDFGNAWVDIVHLFQTFEALHPSKLKAKLGNVNRPTCVHEWIKRGRSATYRPNVTALGNISQDFQSWWRTLQPEWRLSNGNLVLGKGNGDWSTLRISGVNGFLSVMAALFFWRSSLKDNVSWEAALKDVRLALECMVVS